MDMRELAYSDADWPQSFDVLPGAGSLSVMTSAASAPANLDFGNGNPNNSISYPDTEPLFSVSSSSHCFPRSSSSSIGIARSWSTSPLSTSNSDLPAQFAAHFASPHNNATSTTIPAKHAKIIFEDPKAPKPIDFKSKRSCLPCFTRNLKCIETTNPTRCFRCIQGSRYCKGVISAPTLIDVGRFNDKISRLLDAQFVLQDTQQQRQLCAATDALLTLHPRPIVPTGSSHRYYGLRIPELCDNFHFIYDGTCSDEMLDALVATQPPHHSSPAALYDLSLYKCLSWRFCACLALLRTLDRCTVSSTYVGHPRIIVVALGFLYQVSRKLDSTFEEIFVEIRQCCRAKRERKQTLALMFTLVDHLGLMYIELRCLQNTWLRWEDTGFRVTELFINVPATLNALENLARGLRSGNFNFENRFVPLEIDGVHFTLPFPSLSTDEDSINDKSTVSFLEILQTAASESLNEFQNERCGDISYVGQGPSQALQQTCEGLSSYHSLAPAPLEHYMYPLPTNGFDTSVVSLQDDIDATFNPNWTMDSDGNGNLSRTFAGSDQDSLRANTSMATAVNSNWYLDSLPSDFESIDTSIARMGRTKTTFSPPSTRVVTGILNKNCQPSSVFSHTLPRTADVTEQHFKLNDQELLHSAANETQNARLYDVSHRTPRHTNLNTSAQIRRNLTSFLESPY